MTDDGRRQATRSMVMMINWEHLSRKEMVVMERLVFRIVGSLVLLVVTMVSWPRSVSSLPPVQGEVITVTTGIPGTMVIRDDKGQLHILNLTQQTQLGAQFKVGDKVLAFFSPYGVSAVQLQGGNR
ncbi:MAG TPA: hypothetical protein DDY39_19360 [Nitrospira sp.]|nr:hypothetical protein [Nitrospira sp.]HBR50349.1 hypothetical protein [Nitrospira sp.]